MDSEAMARKAAKFLGQKEADYKRKLAHRMRTAQEDFRKIVAIIVEKYEPARIYQWGSLLRTGRFSEISDIDIAVEGLSGKATVLELLGDVQELTDFPLDIVELDHVDPLHADSIRKKGQLIYERSE